jgi:hypothetical protein
VKEIYVTEIAAEIFVRRRRFAAALFLVAAAVAAGYLGLRSPRYLYGGVLEIGSITRLTDGRSAAAPVEDEKTLQGRVTALATEAASTDQALAGITVRPDLRGRLLTLRSSGSESGEAAYLAELRRIGDGLIATHGEMLSRAQAELTATLARSEADLTFLRDPAYLDALRRQNEKEVSEKQAVLAKIDSDLAMTRAALDGFPEREKLVAERLSALAAELRDAEIQTGQLAANSRQQGAEFPLVWSRSNVDFLRDQEFKTRTTLTVDLPHDRAALVAGMTQLEQQKATAALALSIAQHTLDRALLDYRRELAVKTAEHDAATARGASLLPTRWVAAPARIAADGGPGAALAATEILLFALACTVLGVLGWRYAVSLTRVSRRLDEVDERRDGARGILRMSGEDQPL